MSSTRQIYFEANATAVPNSPMEFEMYYPHAKYPSKCMVFNSDKVLPGMERDKFLDYPNADLTLPFLFLAPFARGAAVKLTHFECSYRLSSSGGVFGRRVLLEATDGVSGIKRSRVHTDTGAKEGENAFGEIPSGFAGMDLQGRQLRFLLQLLGPDGAILTIDQLTIRLRYRVGEPAAPPPPTLFKAPLELPLVTGPLTAETMSASTTTETEVLVDDRVTAWDPVYDGAFSRGVVYQWSPKFTRDAFIRTSKIRFMIYGMPADVSTLVLEVFDPDQKRVAHSKVIGKTQGSHWIENTFEGPVFAGVNLNGHQIRLSVRTRKAASVGVKNVSVFLETAQTAAPAGVVVDIDTNTTTNIPGSSSGQVVSTIGSGAPVTQGGSWDANAAQTYKSDLDDKDADEPSSKATTIALGVLGVLVVGGGALYMYRRAKGATPTKKE